jgi:hypothetical protein
MQGFVGFYANCCCRLVVMIKAFKNSFTSLEPFNRDELEKLKEAVEKYHPF